MVLERGDNGMVNQTYLLHSHLTTDNTHIKRTIDDFLLVNYPDEHIEEIKKYLESPKAMYEHRTLLKEMNFSTPIYKIIVRSAISFIEDKAQVRTLQRLRILKNILRSNAFIELEKAIIDDLFLLFQNYVFHQNQEISQQANSLIMKQLLDFSQIAWLIENYNRSEHIVNRLLRYPVVDEQVGGWAKRMYIDGELCERKSEIIGILISNNSYDYLYKDNIKSFLWAIHYSKLDKQQKRQIIFSNVNITNIEECLDAVIEISSRMDDALLVREIAQKVFS